MSELILSDVHINKNITYSDFTTFDCKQIGCNNVYVTEFELDIPDALECELLHRLKWDEESYDSCSSELVQSDEDGDIIVPRRQPRFIRNPLVMPIYHSMASELNSVGLQVWRGALVMSDYVLHNVEQFRGKRVLELGGGVGLTGILVGMISDEVLITDIGGSILRVCEKNISANSVFLKNPTGVKARELDWFKLKDAHELKSINISSFDIILACDVFYDNEVTDAFFRTLFIILTFCLKDMKDASLLVLLSVEKRINFTMAELDVTCKEYDHFQKCLNELENEMTPHLRIELVEIAEIRKCCAYDRANQLEIWRLHISI